LDFYWLKNWWDLILLNFENPNMWTTNISNSSLQLKQETIQKSHEKSTYPTQGQNYSLHTKTFPTIPIMWRFIGGNSVLWGDKGEAKNWKIFIYRLIPGQRHNKKAFNKKRFSFLEFVLRRPSRNFPYTVRNCKRFLLGM
jgi:hypothetical protein